MVRAIIATIVVLAVVLTGLYLGSCLKGAFEKKFKQINVTIVDAVPAPEKEVRQ